MINKSDIRNNQTSNASSILHPPYWDMYYGFGGNYGYGDINIATPDNVFDLNYGINGIRNKKVDTNFTNQDSYIQNLYGINGIKNKKIDTNFTNDNNILNYFGANGRIFKVPAKTPSAYGIDAQPMIDLGTDGQPMMDIGCDGVKTRAVEMVDLTSRAMPKGNPRKEFDLVYGADGELLNKIQDLYNKNSNGESFLQWMQSQNAQNLINNLNTTVQTVKGLAGSIKNKSNNNTGTTVYVPQNYTNNTSNNNNTSGNNLPTSETKIFGMSPVTFGFVALGVTVTVAVATLVLINAEKAQKLTPKVTG